MQSGGDFSLFEIKVKKTIENINENEIAGQWVTQMFLEKEGWESDMIDTSKAWAEKRGYLRTSAVHGREEWRIPLKESFSFKDLTKEEVSASARSHGEDRFLKANKLFLILELTSNKSRAYCNAYAGCFCGDWRCHLASFW